ncbi:MAG: fibronectin type III-like domain-contianing protein [Mariniphaga sp.]
MVDILRNQYNWDGLVVSGNNDIKNMNTTFKLDNIRLQNESIAVGGKTCLNLTISNTGKMDGEEVMQLYVHDLISELKRPVKELRDFRKVFLKAGESKTLSFEIGPKQL